MQRFFQFLALLGLCTLIANSLPVRVASAAPQQPRQGAPAIVGLRGGGTSGKSKVAAPINGTQPFTGTLDLSYHNGGVLTGIEHTYLIFWGTNWSSGYKTLTGQFMHDVAADSGKPSNVFYSDIQYYIPGMPGVPPVHAAYNQVFQGSFVDSFLPASGCSDTSAGTLRCYTDAQIQGEINHALTMQGWSNAYNSMFFVLLGDGISQCSGSMCADQSYCAYHSHFQQSQQLSLLYAVVPYGNHDPSACGSGWAPNGDAAADSAINLVAVLANEMVTDPMHLGWYAHYFYDYENGDNCAWNFGKAQGGTLYTPIYNQLINGHRYWLQQEWSNASHGCVQTGV